MCQPTQKFKAGLVQASIFENTAQGKDGEFKSHSVQLQVSYQKDGKWNNPSLTIVKKNLANAIKVLQQAAKELEVSTGADSPSYQEISFDDEITDEQAYFTDSEVKEMLAQEMM